jgi:nitroreductase
MVRSKKVKGYNKEDLMTDIKWAKQYLEYAKKIQVGEKIEWSETIPKPFTNMEMEVVNKLIYGRRSLRNWADKTIPDEMIEKILEAGRAAPIGCNLDEVRFIVLKEPKEIEMIWSDISTKNSIIIVVCYDKRIHRVVGQDKLVPQNAGFDSAAAADHMLLMAHALGLGAVWLSKTAKTEKRKDTGEEFKRKYGLPEYIEVALHIAVGWPTLGTIKTKRMPLQNMIISQENR